MFRGIARASRFVSGSVVMLALLLLVLTLCPALLNAQTEQPDQQKMAQEYMKMMSPNENHAYFKDIAGKWDVKTVAWMAMGQESTVTKGTCDASLMFGGRFLMMKFSSTMMGQPFEGIEILGYDNLKKKYVTFWIDNQSTNFYLTEGTRDSLTKVETETGDWGTPMGGTMPVRSVTKVVNKDTIVYELYMTMPGGQEFKSVENTMTRKKMAAGKK